MKTKTTTQLAFEVYGMIGLASCIIIACILRVMGVM